MPAVAFLGLTAVRVVRQPKLNFDEHIFLDVGRHILDTGLPTRAYGFRTPSLFFDHTPLYVYLVAALTAIGGPTELIIRSTTLVFGLLTVLLVYRIGLELRGVGSALVGLDAGRAESVLRDVLVVHPDGGTAVLLPRARAVPADP